MGLDQSVPAEGAVESDSEHVDGEDEEYESNYESQEYADGEDQLPDFLEETKSGYRVLAVHDGSPACNAGLVPFFDFIVMANMQPLTEEDDLFVSIIRRFENKPLSIVVYNCKCKQLREVTFVPKRDWGGAGLLGLTIKYDSFEGAEDHVIHVLDVHKNSPAAKAGFEPYTDYLLGTPFSAFHELDELYDLVTEVVEDNLGDKGIDVFVYSTKTDTVRRLLICPSANWGGEGVLGCGIGYGYLHRLPKEAQRTPGCSRAEDLIPATNGKSIIPSRIPEALERHTNNDNDDQQVPETTLQKVETIHGPGHLCGTKANGINVIHLDWSLPNGATAIAFLRKGSFTTMKTDHKPNQGEEALEENNVEVIDVNLNASQPPKSPLIK